MIRLLLVVVLVLSYSLYCSCTTSSTTSTTSTSTASSNNNNNNDEWETVHSSEIPFDIPAMRRSMSAKEVMRMTSEFGHLPQLSKALADTTSHFYVYDSINDHNGWDLSDYDDVVTRAYHYYFTIQAIR